MKRDIAVTAFVVILLTGGMPAWLWPPVLLLLALAVIVWWP